MGIFSGFFIYVYFAPPEIAEGLASSNIILGPFLEMVNSIIENAGDSWNMAILLFLALLGALVAIVTVRKQLNKKGVVGISKWRLGPAGIKWLKNFHILFCCLWIGAGASMTVVQLFSKPSSVEELLGYMYAINLINGYVNIIGAIGCLVTGLIYSLFTNWGFFKYYWVITKWIANIAIIILGSVVLGPAAMEMMGIIGTEGLAALNNPGYVQAKNLNTYIGLGSLLVLALLVFISIFKPWGQRANTGEKISA